MKFKVGDRVKILPSAVAIGVFKSEIDKTGIITDCNYMDEYIMVYMDSDCKEVNWRKEWAVQPDQIEKAIKVGQQLLFSFME